MAAFALALSCCGYHVAGHGDLMPKTIQTVCVPAFKNATSRQKLSDRLPEAIAREFISRTISDLLFLLPHYIHEGKSYLTIAFGCTGGQHRSVMIAEEVGKHLRRSGYSVKVAHRDSPK